MTATFHWFDVDQETEQEREFYEACQVGDTSYQCVTDEPRTQSQCGTRVSGLMYCTRGHGHDGTRHVAEGITEVLAVSRPSAIATSMAA